MNDLEVMILQAEVLFVHNSDGRMTRINESIRQPAPKFFLGRTNNGDVCRFREDLPDHLIEEITKIVKTNKNTVDLIPLIHAIEKFDQVHSVWLGPAYVFAGLTCPSTEAIKVTEDNKHLLNHHFGKVLSELDWRQPCFMMIEDDVAVSVCFSARQSGQACEAGLETAEGYRGKGYASEVTTAWAAAVRTENRIPLYSTAWDNYASQSIATKLGLLRYGTDLSIY